ncbi:acyl-CoA dehydrogenase [Piscinibacter gummiphilus]|uniref:Acyl-CoA dehydrogenase n=1 Tax=Piscinibacter gummiphilus TaxID=946333 RepID=A0ABZ0CRN6_9BURK|nr:acyl-CoA dehydrogenase [Piscinibacter gummiphilus]WOB07599.1 acyl-CoA dehydrogenase [Piscinibacter gummiphilus]
MTAELILNRRDLDFQIFEVNDAEALTQRERHADHSRETFVAALDAAMAIAADKFFTHNRESDEQEPEFDGKRVEIIPQVKDALQAYCEAGFIAPTQDYDLGGMQLPVLMGQAFSAIFKSANAATNSYVGLTIANANVINRFGTESQKKRYLPHMLSGRFFGTMCLTEPQAGSSLSDITTAAVPQGDGSYRLTGNKIFISGGDHELSENIIHLVLARLPGAPAGVKGISLFIVPKFMVNDDGSLGARNDVALAGLIHKMGWRGTTSTMLSFGEKGQCYGELIGQPNQGLAAMFHMMNEARIGVGMGAVMLGYRGYLASLQYARERPQGRRAGSKDPNEPQIKLIAHADIRRMLIAQKAYVEGGLSLGLYAARLVDEQKTGPDETKREEAGLLLELLTPIVKSWPSQWCLEANSLAIQIHGGYGYTREYPVEQFYRDNRLNMIHEGTHAIQSIDLLGRKVVMQQGAALELLGREIAATVKDASAYETLSANADALTIAWSNVVQTVKALAPLLKEKGELALANSVVFLEAFGHTVVAWQWLRQALVATRALKDAKGDDEINFYRGKLHTCAWFFDWELPRCKPQHELLRSLNDSTLTMQDAWF